MEEFKELLFANDMIVYMLDFYQKTPTANKFSEVVGYKIEKSVALLYTNDKPAEKESHRDIQTHTRTYRHIHPHTNTHSET